MAQLCDPNSATNNAAIVKSMLDAQSFNSLLRVHPFPWALLQMCAKEPQSE